MQNQNKLKVIINFIRSNSKKTKKFFKRFEIDSRKISSGQVFLSLDHNKSKNLINIRNAIQNNASSFITICELSRKELDTTIPYLIVNNIEELYKELFFHDVEIDYSKKKLIGVTGTNGKTSTCLLLAQALSYCNKKVGVITSEGIGVYPFLDDSEYTTPPIDVIYKNYIELISKKCEYLIIECSSQGLQQERLGSIQFDYSLITNIYSDHIDYHKTLEKYIKSKLLIINKSRTVILNYDSPNLRNIKKNKYPNTNIYSISSKNIKDKSIFNSIENIDKSKSFHPCSLLMIEAIMKLDNYKESTIKKSILKLKPLRGRRQIINTKNKGNYIIDYAHSAQSYEDIFKSFNSDETITTLFGCGGDRDKSKRKITGRIVDKYSSHIIITEDNSRTEKFESIISNIKAGISDKSKLTIIRSRKQALKKLYEKSKKNDMNFILGKGNENYIIRNNNKIVHNDINYIRELIDKDEN